MFRFWLHVDVHVFCLSWVRAEPHQAYHMTRSCDSVYVPKFMRWKRKKINGTRCKSTYKSKKCMETHKTEKSHCKKTSIFNKPRRQFVIFLLFNNIKLWKWKIQPMVRFTLPSIILAHVLDNKDVYFNWFKSSCPQVVIVELWPILFVCILGVHKL